MRSYVDGSWAADLGPNLGPDTLHEFFALWQAVSAWEANEDLPDEIAWSWEAKGHFLVRSAYVSAFGGREVMPTADLTWKSRAPTQCRFFTWLAMKNRCWTSDRFARRGLPHQDACPFCDQEEETINHIMLTCVFARSAWAAICGSLGKPEWIPSPNDVLTEWAVGKKGVNNVGMKDLRTIFALVWWELWKHRNAIVFDGAQPSIEQLLQRVREEGVVWSSAGLLKGNVTPFFRRVERWVSGED